MGNNKRLINVNGPAFRAIYKANPAEAARIAAGAGVDLAKLFPGRGNRRAGSRSPRAARSPRRARSPRVAKYPNKAVLNPNTGKMIDVNGAAFRKLHNEHPSVAKRLAEEAGVDLKVLFPGRGRPKSTGPAKKRVRKPVSPSKRRRRRVSSGRKVINPLSGKMIAGNGRLAKKLMADGVIKA
jgi:hypothetical protein